jgi:hypothetical protein
MAFVRRLILLIVAVTVPLAATAPALAQEAEKQDDLIVLHGRALLPQGDTVDTVVVFNGSVTIDGSAGDVVIFNGPATITGAVGKDVVSFNGTVTVRSGASVGGDVISRTEPVIEEGATVRGEIRRTPGELFREPFPFFARLASWVAVSISTLVLGLLFLAFAPRAADAIEVAGRGAIGPLVGWGLLLLIGLPLVAILAFITLVGIPFGLGLGLALFLIFALGYTMTAWLLGRRLVKAPSSRFAAFLVGLVILRGVALIPIVAGIIGTIAVVVGLGAIVVAIWRARRPAPATV